MDSLKNTITNKLLKNRYECQICVSKIGKRAQIWFCDSCWNIYHRTCTLSWIEKSLKSDDFWRCPTCNKSFLETIGESRCFCGKFENPDFDPFITPHSCGQVCCKTLKFCGHPCITLCHPGPCPKCSLNQVVKKCPCGKKETKTKCSGESLWSEGCGSVCGKKLSCGIHSCSQQCHTGSCNPCNVAHKNKCFCGRTEKVVKCSEKAVPFSCEKVCSRPLDCKNHQCLKKCHRGGCKSCPRIPKITEKCACGKTTMQDSKRKSCLSHLKTCEKVCAKPLSCGRHSCKKQCHDSNCGECAFRESNTCVCGSKSKKVKCSRLNRPFSCNARCKRILSCKKHKCDRKCCSAYMIESSEIHKCIEKCGAILNCKIHNCEDNCHSGSCAPCRVQMRNGLSCACGAVKVKGYFFCGEKILKCEMICFKRLSCGHYCTDKCHFGECPQCKMKATKTCSTHKTSIEIACSNKDEEVVCDKKCNKLLPCKDHFCTKNCHLGNCIKIKLQQGKISCGKKCNKVRSDCGHVCNSICHPGKLCTELPCKQIKQAVCACGRKNENVYCNKFDLNKILNCDGKCKALKLKEALSLETNEDESIIFKGFISDLWIGDEIVAKLSRDKEYVYFSKSLLEISITLELSQIKKLVQKFDDFVDKNNTEKTLYLNPMGAQKRLIVHSLANYYNITGETIDREKAASVRLIKERASGKPSVSFYEAIRSYMTEPDKSILGWPCGNALHIINIRKAGKTLDLVETSLSQLIDDFDFYRFSVLNAFAVFKTPEEMQEAKNSLRGLLLAKIKIQPAAIRDEIGLRNYLWDLNK